MSRLRSVIVLLLLSVAGGMLARAASAQTMDTVSCAGGTLRDTLNIGPMVHGETRDTSFYVRNATLGDSLTLGTLNTKRLNILTSVLSVSPGDSTLVRFRYFADTLGFIPASLTMQPDSSGCSVTTKAITAFVTDPMRDSAALTLVHPATQFIAFHSTSDSSSLLIKIQNNSFDSVTITGVRLKDGTNYSASAEQTFPLKLYRGESLRLRLTFARRAVGSARDSLIITIPNMPTGTEGYIIVGYRSDSLDVPITRPATPLQTHYFSAVPNPLQGELRLVGPRLMHGSVEIRDVLGNTLHSMSAAAWHFDAREEDLPNGVYYIHIAGETDQAAEVNETLRVVVTK